VIHSSYICTEEKEKLKFSDVRGNVKPDAISNSLEAIVDFVGGELSALSNSFSLSSISVHRLRNAVDISLTLHIFLLK
jgi:hypothetical protein